ncbi:MAG: FtsW/RodA/SpoVE family cell cycle protein [Peptococcaceae bacterium]|nr:FtsW/RodA/SpoVE family cell cycle protein [Peptococcaceae bacterium]
MTRRDEISLLLLAGLFLAVGAFTVYLWRGGDARAVFTGAAVPALAFLLLGIMWQALGFRADQYLLPVVAVFSYASLVFLYRLQPEYAYRQFVWLMAGLFFLFLTTSLFPRYRWLSEYKYVYGLLGVLLLIVPIFFGVEQGGARSWLDFGLFHLQPSEFVKILAVLFLASFMSENKMVLARGTRSVLGLALPGPGEWGPLMGMWGVSLILLAFQRDLGTALIYFGTFLAMVYVATARVLYITFGLGLFTAGGALSCLLFDHVKQRVDIWLLNPYNFIELGDREYNQAYQIIQSLFAIGAGGVTGAGLGAGYPRYIPAVHTDFIFAAITEEMGLAGGLGIVLLYLFFVYRGLKVALEARDDFSKLLASGLTALMGLQAFIIIAGVTKLLPLTGVTLPFISYGGSSLVANFIILGMLLSISHEARSHER